MSLKTWNKFGEYLCVKDFDPVDYAKIFAQNLDKEEDSSHLVNEEPNISKALANEISRLRKAFNISDKPPIPCQPGKVPGCLPESYLYLLLKEFLYREDFPEMLLKVKDKFELRRSFAQLMKVHNLHKLILITNSRSDLLKVFKNMIIACRLLPPKRQKEIIVNLGPLHQAASSMAALDHSGVIKELPALKSLIPFFLDFKILPVSYSNTAKTSEDHFFAFTETIWDLFPMILESAGIREIVETDSSYDFLEVVYDSVRRPKFGGETWEAIVGRMVKRPKWMRSLNLVISKTGIREDEVEDSMETKVELHQFLCVLNRQSMHEVVEAFKDRSEKGKRTQLLLSELLIHLPRTSWDLRMLDFARQIKSNSALTHKNVLVAAYHGLSLRALHKEYCSDIIDGLQGQDGKSWISVLYEFSTGNRPKAYYVYDAFYGPVKAMLEGSENIRKDLDIKNYQLMSKVFSSVILTVNSITAHDWRLLCNLNSNLTHPEVCVPLLVQIPVLNLNDHQSIRKLTGAFLPVNEKLRPKYVFILIRLLESTPKPVELSLSILFSLEKKHDGFLNSSYIWFLLAAVAKIAQTSAVHEKLLSLLLMTVRTDRKKNKFLEPSAPAIYEVFQFLQARNWCRPDIYRDHSQSIAAAIKEGFKQKDFSACQFYHYSLILYLCSDPSILLPSDILSLPIHKTEIPKTMAALVLLHRKVPSKIVEADFKGILEMFLASDSLEYRDFFTCIRYSSLLVDFIQEFNSEPYFDQVRPTLIGLEKKCTGSLGFYPRLMLLEARRYLDMDQQIPNQVKVYLLSGKYHWISNNDLTSDEGIERHLFLRQEHRYVIKETAKLFVNFAESLTVKFFADLYFLNLETVTNVFSVPALAQLVR
jgi:hypothetical protein